MERHTGVNRSSAHKKMKEKEKEKKKKNSTFRKSFRRFLTRDGNTFL
jgi:hypothetical protein